MSAAAPVAEGSPSGFRGRYGASPWHLVVLVVHLVVAGYAVGRVLLTGTFGNWALWFLGAILAHDLLVFPAYAGLDRLLRRSAPRRPRRVPVVNHVRVPLLLSGLLLLVWFPLVLGTEPDGYRRKTGLGVDVYLARWLLVSGLLVAGSALVFALRLARAHRSARPAGERTGAGSA